MYIIGAIICKQITDLKNLPPLFLLLFDWGAEFRFRRMTPCAIRQAGFEL